MNGEILHSGTITRNTIHSDRTKSIRSGRKFLFHFILHPNASNTAIGIIIGSHPCFQVIAQSLISGGYSPCGCCCSSWISRSFLFGNNSNNIIIKDTQQGGGGCHAGCIVTFMNKQFIEAIANQFMRSSRQVRKGLVNANNAKGKGGQGQDTGSSVCEPIQSQPTVDEILLHKNSTCNPNQHWCTYAGSSQFWTSGIGNNSFLVEVS